MKQCTKCGEQKPLSEYNTRSDNGKLLNKCKKCVKEYSKTHYLKNLTKRADQKLKKTYGISLSEKHAMLKYQNNKCSICKKQLKTEKDKHVDHCHKNGKVRAILCSCCNVMLGMSKDSTTVLKSAIMYLNKHAKKEAA